MPVIAALDQLLDEQPALKGRVELHVYGGPLDRLSAAAIASARHSTVRHFGRIEADPVSGKSGREQILQRMRSADVLLLLHGIEPICAEYIPSKMYEYLWMQRPILALVYRNPQMADLLRREGHCVLGVEHWSGAKLRGPDRAVLQPLADRLEQFSQDWTTKGLFDNGSISSYTTFACVKQLCVLLRV